MKRVLFSSLTLLFLFGCGGGSNSSGNSSNGSSTSSTPSISLSQESIELVQGETKMIRSVISNMPQDSSTIETSVDTTRYDQSIVDFVTYITTNQNDKDVNILVYGANPGESVINIIADSGSKKVPKELKVRVLGVDKGIDIVNGNINAYNPSSGITSITKTFDFDGREVIGKLELKTPSTCGNNSYINGSDLNFKIDEQKVLINLNLFRYNIQGDREFSKVITDINVTSDEQRDNNETVVIPSKAIEINGMDFALNTVDVNNIYTIGLKTDMCTAEFKLKLLDLVLDLDSDLDGVSDNIDQCINTPRGSKVDEVGCSIDEDSDGVEDNEDLCPNTPKGTQVNESGCPDSDGDGVADTYDICPNEFGTLENGCPDGDGDGVADKDDACPNEAGTGSDGCPIATPIPTPTVTQPTSSTPKPTSSPSPTAVGTPTPTSSGTGTTPTGSAVPTPTATSGTSNGNGGDITPVTDPNELKYACTTNDGYKVLSNNINQVGGVDDGSVYFRAETYHSLYFYYKPITESRSLKSIDLNRYVIPNTNDSFILIVNDKLADGVSKFYVLDGTQCFRGTFPLNSSIRSGVFPDKTLTFIKSIN